MSMNPEDILRYIAPLIQSDQPNINPQINNPQVNFPNPEDYSKGLRNVESIAGKIPVEGKPKWYNRLTAAMAGGSAGYMGGGQAGVSTALNALKTPYAEAIENWQRKLGAAKMGADIESERYKRAMQEATLRSLYGYRGTQESGKMMRSGLTPEGKPIPVEDLSAVNKATIEQKTSQSDHQKNLDKLNEWKMNNLLPAQQAAAQARADWLKADTEPGLPSRKRIAYRSMLDKEGLYKSIEARNASMSALNELRLSGKLTQAEFDKYFGALTVDIPGAPMVEGHVVGTQTAGGKTAVSPKLVNAAAFGRVVEDQATDLKKFADANPDLFGALKGRWNHVINWVGGTETVPSTEDPRVGELVSKLASLHGNIVNLHGQPLKEPFKMFSAAGGQDIDSPAVFKAKLDGMIASGKTAGKAAAANIYKGEQQSIKSQTFTESNTGGKYVLTVHRGEQSKNYHFDSKAALDKFKVDAGLK